VVLQYLHNTSTMWLLWLLYCSPCIILKHIWLLWWYCSICTVPQQCGYCGCCIAVLANYFNNCCCYGCCTVVLHVTFMEVATVVAGTAAVTVVHEAHAINIHSDPFTLLSINAIFQELVSM